MKVTLKKPTIKFNLTKFTKLFVNIGSNNLSQVSVLFISLIVLNIFSQKYFLRIDLTETKTYTLSEGTKNILKSLDDTVTIKTFFSDNIPPDLIQTSKDTKDTYEEYIRFSDGKIQLEIKNSKDENFRKDAIAAGLPEVQYQEYSKDKYEIAKGFLGVSISYKDKTEVIELVTPENIRNIEYETSSRIYKLANEEKIQIGFLTGHGEKSINADYSSVNKLLSTEFSVKEITFSEGEPIDPEQIKVLVVAAPTGSLSERDMFEIDQYIMQGGRVVFLADQYQFGYESALMAKSESNLTEFIKNYGIEVADSIILDESYLPLQMIFAYPYWVLTQSENLSKDNPALSQLESLVFFWSNPAKEAKTNEDQTFTSLIKTTKNAWEKTGDSISVDPSEQFVITDTNQFTIAMLVEGKQTSVYKDKEIPGLEGEVEDKRTEDHNRFDETDDTKIVVIGDSDFIIDDLLSGSEQNPIFFVNLIEWLASAEDLISIRSKNIETRPLQVVPESQKFLIKAANIFVVPILTIAIGITYNILRKKKESSI